MLAPLLSGLLLPVQNRPTFKRRFGLPPPPPSVHPKLVLVLRGDRGARKNIVDIDSLDLNLEPQGQG